MKHQLIAAGLLLTLNIFPCSADDTKSAQKDKSAPAPVFRITPHRTGFTFTPRDKSIPFPKVYLGIASCQTDATTGSLLGLHQGIGLTVTLVAPNSPAALAKLKCYDVIHKLDQQIMVNESQLITLLNTYKVGDPATLTYFREGKSHQATIVFASQSKLNRSTSHIHLSKSVKNYRGTFLLSSTAEGAILTIHKPNGELIFNGPVTTDEQFTKIPIDIPNTIKKYRASILSTRIQTHPGKLNP